ncbi:MAG: amidohydrolase family protein [Tissierellia bacterium]|nr:amidohydrolase family protein [Tissierellia bacterium]
MFSKHKKFDAHSHIGDFGGWAGSFAIDKDQLVRDMDSYQVEKTILCAADAPRNQEVLEAYEAYPDRLIPLVFVNPAQGEAALEEARYYLKEKNFKGIKMHPLMHAYVADSPIADPFLDLAEEVGVPVFIHSGHPPYSLPWSIALLAQRHPRVKVVMIHMGHGHGMYVEAALDMAQRFDNIYLEMSGMPMSVKIREAYEKVGRDRIMFGIDAPFHHPTVEIQKVLTSGLDEEGLEDVFYNNAAKLMGYK